MLPSISSLFSLFSGVAFSHFSYPWKGALFVGVTCVVTVASKNPLQNMIPGQLIKRLCTLCWFHTQLCAGRCDTVPPSILVSKVRVGFSCGEIWVLPCVPGKQTGFFHWKVWDVLSQYGGCYLHQMDMCEWACLDLLGSSVWTDVWACHTIFNFVATKMLPQMWTERQVAI